MSSVHLQAGNHGRALELIDAGIEAVGGAEGIFPDFWIIRGDILRASPQETSDAPEDSYRTAAGTARAMGIRFIELKARSRLVDLLRDSQSAENEQVAFRAVYDTIDGGQDEVEMVRARELLVLRP